MQHATSPWTLLTEYESLRLEDFNMTGSGAFTVPGSKSFSNRALIIAATCANTTTLSGLLKSDDTYWCIDSLKKMGIIVDEKNDQFTITPPKIFSQPDEELFIGAAGTIARFLPGVLAAMKNFTFKVTSDYTLEKRPISPLIDSLKSLGASIKYLKESNHLPIQIESSGLDGGTINLPGDISSQYLSGLLICAPLAQEPITINLTTDIVQPNYVKMTLDIMKEFGVHVKTNESFNQFSIKPSEYKSKEYVVEADVSSAGYLFALSALSGEEICISNLNKDTLQPDLEILDIFEKMGCKIDKSKEHIKIKGPKILKGGFSVSLKEFSDQALTLGCIAPFADGPIEITEIGHIRKHECDRIEALSSNLSKMGIRSETTESSIKIYPGDISPASIETFSDHRVAMAFSTMAAKVKGIEILNPSCVAKTFPNFYDVLEKTGFKISYKKIGSK